MIPFFNIKKINEQLLENKMRGIVRSLARSRDYKEKSVNKEESVEESLYLEVLFFFKKDTGLKKYDFMNHKSKLFKNIQTEPFNCNQESQIFSGIKKSNIGMYSGAICLFKLLPGASNGDAFLEIDSFPTKYKDLQKEYRIIEEGQYEELQRRNCYPPELIDIKD